MKKRLYRITVKNFRKHNPNLKKNHKYTMIANNLCSDSALRMLPVTVRWMFIGILLSCGDHASDVVELSESQLRDLLESSKSVVGALDALKSLQLLTYEIQDYSFINRIEKNRKERNRIETSSVGTSKNTREENPAPEVLELKPQPTPAEQTALNREIWNTYAAAYRNRYKVDPVRNASVNGKISQLGKRLGREAIAVVEFFLSHNDGYYLKNLHSIGLCLRDAESLHTQMQRGRAITSLDVKNFEAEDHFRQQLERLNKGEIKV